MFVKLGHAHFQPFHRKETFFKLGLNGEGKKNVRFSTETSHISETVRDTAKVTVNH